MPELNELKLKISSFPTSPGVYIMKDSRRKILYVGKAKNLKSRVLSYFNQTLESKVRFLMGKVFDIEPILTATEYEALLLENSLIKRHKPRYNIDLRDGKSFPVIRITNEDFPRVFRTRRIVRDGSHYFGPFPNVRAVDIYIELIRKLYPLRRCHTLHKRISPCLYYHINQCQAPCTGSISKEEYSKYIKKIKSLLSGRTAGFRKQLENLMHQTAEELDFEKAAELRDSIKSLDILESDSTVVDFNQQARDYIHFIASGRYVVFAVIQMRSGQISDRQIFTSEYAGETSEALMEFLLQYYSESGRSQPAVLYIPEEHDEMLQRFFEENKDQKIKIVVPSDKRDKAALAMTLQNARDELDRVIRKEGDIPALKSLKQVLDLPHVPKLIEGFDIAQLHGKHMVASLVSFIDGKPNKAGYRHYNITSTLGQVNDYKAIAEAVGRRYQRLINEEHLLPDLLLVDGGRGQVSAAMAILKLLNLDGKIPCIGLSKKNEEIWKTDHRQPVRLPTGDPALRILQHVRDETHRFATTHSRKLRSKELTLTTLEGIPGIGPVKSRKLLKTYKSLANIYQSSVEEIAGTANVGFSVAETVREFLGKTLESREAGREQRDRRLSSMGK